jgi:indole-3-glycerol phosphate synthase
MNILDQIIESKREEVKDLKKKYSMNSYQSMKFYESEIISFIYKLNSDNKISLICEIKKASPSKGIIRNNFDHIEIAEIYFKNDVDAISILTDKNFFKGDMLYLRQIAKIKQAPLLRKDFIIDEIQIYESKANGADLILLISEILSITQIADFTSIANEIGLEILLEIHSSEQLDKIDFDKNKLIGINNRNLNDFSVSLNTTAELKKLIPEDIFVVSESGISKKEDVIFLKDSGVNALLVGESIMADDDIEVRVKELKKWCGNEG